MCIFVPFESISFEQSAMSWQLQEHVRIHTLKCSATYISLSEATHFEGFSGACCHQPDSKNRLALDFKPSRCCKTLQWVIQLDTKVASTTLELPKLRHSADAAGGQSPQRMETLSTWAAIGVCLLAGLRTGSNPMDLRTFQMSGSLLIHFDPFC